MADEVRQKFEDFYDEAYAGELRSIIDRQAAWKFYQEGKRAGEIARWIPVTEKLPEITSQWGPGDFYGGSDEVLAYNGHICTAVRYKSGTWGSADEGSKLTGVTHWQPLPAAPETCQLEGNKFTCGGKQIGDSVAPEEKP